MTTAQWHTIEHWAAVAMIAGIGVWMVHRYPGGVQEVAAIAGPTAIVVARKLQRSLECIVDKFTGVRMDMSWLENLIATALENFIKSKIPNPTADENTAIDVAVTANVTLALLLLEKYGLALAAKKLPSVAAELAKLGIKV